MRFLLDENVSPAVAAVLGRGGHDAVHVRDLGLMSAPDEAVLANLPAIEGALVDGAIAVLEDERLRIRSLPFGPHV